MIATMMLFGFGTGMAIMTYVTTCALCRIAATPAIRDYAGQGIREEYDGRE